MEWVNVTAKSLPEAIDLALDNLGVDEAEAEIEVLEEPKQGLFGRTRGNARVKARVKPRSTRPKIERGRNKRRRESGSERGGKSGRDSAKKSSGAKKSADSGNDSNRSKSQGRAANDRDRASDQSGSDDTKSRGGRSGNGQKVGDGDGPRRGGRATKQRDSAPPKEAPVEEVSATIESFLSGLTDAFGLEGGVEVVSDGDEGLIGQVEGRHGLLVGPRGRTLDAIQELTRVTAQRTSPSSIRIKVDVGGYRQMRAEALQAFAMEAAEAAKADGKERSLEPMSSADRKIVHDALNEVDGVETRSAGTDPRRRVVVVPTVVVSDDEGDDEADEVETHDTAEVETDETVDVEEEVEEVEEVADESESVVD